MRAALTRCGRVAPASIVGYWACLFACAFTLQAIYQVIPPIIIGFFVGMMSAIMGVGGGFIMVPAMIYLRMPTNVVIGTSLFKSFSSRLSDGVSRGGKPDFDIVLAVLLMIGGVIGAQIGAYVGQRLQGEQLRYPLALIVLAVGARLLFDLVVEPQELYSISAMSSLSGDAP